jgi:hypothetical protein
MRHQQDVNQCSDYTNEIVLPIQKKEQVSVDEAEGNEKQ